MEQTSYKLPYVHVSQPAKDVLKYIDNRRKGLTRSLKTRWSKFNRQCMGGIESNVIYTIAGISGSGKSSFVNTLSIDLCELNDPNEFMILNFSFEMLNERQMGRALSYKMQKTTTELYSGYYEDSKESLSETDYNIACRYADEISKYPLYYVDRPGTTDEIRATIQYFQEKYLDKWLIVVLDHTLLTRGKTGQSERDILSELQRVFMEAKKVGKTTIIQLSQINREIQSVERLNNPSMHFPMRRDIFGSESIFQSSDYLMVLHRPEVLGIVEYGVNKWPVKNALYIHFLKVRDGEPKILCFLNRLKYNNIEETDILTLKQQTQHAYES